ncbi:MAG: hypothetical protein SFU25_06790, partial [Candidatus Caenarcaniphilales bacterium]|nr:hypothetical protein [Candidatus Caenarcaniphilales bacterium]
RLIWDLYVSLEYLMKKLLQLFFWTIFLFSFVFLGLLLITSLGWFGGGEAILHKPPYGVDYENNVIFSIGGRDASDQTLHERAEELARLTHTPVIQINPGNFPNHKMEEIKSYFYRLLGTSPVPVVHSLKKEILKQLKLGKKVYLVPFSAGNFIVQTALEELKLTRSQKENLVCIAAGSPVSIHQIEALSTEKNYKVIELTDPRDGLILCSQKPTLERKLAAGAPPIPVSKVLSSIPELINGYILSGALDECLDDYKASWIDGKDPHNWEDNYLPMVVNIYKELVKESSSLALLRSSRESRHQPSP